MEVERADMSGDLRVRECGHEAAVRRSVLEEDALTHGPSLAERDGTGNHLRGWPLWIAS